MTTSPIELWGGPECTLNRVGNRYFDQIERSGHARRLEDLDAFAALGFSAVRYPVLWERVAPDHPDQRSWHWSDTRLAHLRALGIRPIAGLLHHGSGPRYTSLIDPDFPRLFARYAGSVAARYPWITDYTPINEPLTTARFSGLYGHWYPHHRNDRSFVRALINQLHATVLAMQAIRAHNPAARLIQTEDCGECFGTPITAPQVRFENHRRWITWDLLCGRVDRWHPLRRYLLAHGATEAELEMFLEASAVPQVVGLNYYVTSDRYLDEQLHRYPPATHGGNGRLRYADVEAVRARTDGIAGHSRHLRSAWQRYGIPVALTEVHLGCSRDEQMRWLHEAWAGAIEARDSGAAVEAVTPWALFGSFDWDSLVTIARGRYESGAFDVRAERPRPTAVARVISAIAKGAQVSEPALVSPGWWRRPGRLFGGERHGVVPFRPRARQPLLVLGRNGTLARACAQVAESRGLDVAVAGRLDVDVTDEAALRRVIDRVKPWAVVNATGYVRVDDAEIERELCYSVNTAGAVQVATACAERNLPLITFSSDLVFDGTSRNHPYTEHDQPRPLNVYGASKAEAERLILAVLPSALVVRTSAFFGPWDRHNFVVQTLAALRQGRRWRAAADVVVSPTYVPDLVNAALDLLLDRESGLWHLSNEGPISWYEFARAAARACGERADLVVPAAAEELQWPAARPRYSALASVRGRVMRTAAEALAAFAEANEAVRAVAS